MQDDGTFAQAAGLHLKSICKTCQNHESSFLGGEMTGGICFSAGEQSFCLGVAPQD